MRPKSVWNDVLGTRAVTSIVRQDCKAPFRIPHCAKRYQEEYTTKVVNIWGETSLTEPDAGLQRQCPASQHPLPPELSLEKLKAPWPPSQCPGDHGVILQTSSLHGPGLFGAQITDDVLQGRAFCVDRAEWWRASFLLWSCFKGAVKLEPV